MKLTYNNGETIVTVDGTQDEVFTWYKTFVHSQTVCEQNTDTAFVELINRKTSEKEVVNDPRAGEPDEDGWITWVATEDDCYPNGLRMTTRVDFKAHYNDGIVSNSVSELCWNNKGNYITKFRLSK